MSIITLSTDIGTNDYIVGAMKGQLVSAVPELNIIDITHNLSSSNYPQSAYICGNAFPYFPENTIHVILLDLFEKVPDHFLIAGFHHQYIACPDNGILTMITNEKPDKLISVPVKAEHGITTLDITAVLAHTIAQMHAGIELEYLGTPTVDIEEKYSLHATIGTDWIEGQIIFIDHFENVVVNITREEFEEHRKGRDFKIVFTRNETIQHISENYASVAVGDKFAWFNSAGFLEISINKGNVAGLFGLQGFMDGGQSNSAQQSNWFYKTVRIFFEQVKKADQPEKSPQTIIFHPAPQEPLPEKDH